MEKQGTQTKQCAHCKRTLTLDHFGVSKNASDGHGLQAWCKECHSEYQRLERLYRKQGKGGVTVCKRCKKFKARKDFPKYRTIGVPYVCGECRDEINGNNAKQEKEKEQPQTMQPTLFDKPLDAYSVEELKDELKRRGYKGELQKIETLTI